MNNNNNGIFKYDSTGIKNYVGSGDRVTFAWRNLRRLLRGYRLPDISINPFMVSSPDMYLVTPQSPNLESPLMYIKILEPTHMGNPRAGTPAM